jgi:preprotein translocase subunit SecE
MPVVKSPYLHMTIIVLVIVIILIIMIAPKDTILLARPSI